MKTFNYETVKVTPAIHERLFRDLKETGQFFTAVFIKKTTNELRLMVCRFGVKKHVNGGGLKYNAKDMGYLPVWDSEKKDYRMLNLNSLLLIHYAKKTYQF